MAYELRLPSIIFECHTMKHRHLFILLAAVVSSSLRMIWLAFNRQARGPTYRVDMQGSHSLVLVMGSTPPRWVPGSSGSLPRGLSQEDLGQIRHAIRHELWHAAFDPASWQTLRQAPGALCRLVTTRVKEVEVLMPDEVQVKTRSYFGDYFFVLRKGQFRPRPTPTFGPPTEVKREGILTEAEFGESLSNHATLTFSR